MSRLVKKISKKNKGFTLIEMIVVVAIIAILVSIAVPQALNQINKAKVSADLANARNIAMAIQQYVADGGNLPQQGIWTSVKDDSNLVNNVIQKYLSGGIPQVKYNSTWNFEYRYKDDAVYVGVYEGNINDNKNYQLYPQVTQTAQNADGSPATAANNPYYGK